MEDHFYSIFHKDVHINSVDTDIELDYSIKIETYSKVDKVKQNNLVKK